MQEECRGVLQLGSEGYSGIIVSKVAGEEGQVVEEIRVSNNRRVQHAAPPWPVPDGVLPSLVPARQSSR